MYADRKKGPDIHCKYYHTCIGLNHRHDLAMLQKLPTRPLTLRLGYKKAKIMGETFEMELQGLFSGSEHNGQAR